jgi:hypothetical protein
MLSVPRRLTCRFHGPEWASPSTPFSVRFMKGTDVLIVPFFSDVFTEITLILSIQICLEHG